MVSLVASESPDRSIMDLVPVTPVSLSGGPDADSEGTRAQTGDPQQAVVQELREDGRPSCLDPFDREAALKQALTTLRLENSQLKELVVRLSETILKSVVGKSAIGTEKEAMTRA